MNVKDLTEELIMEGVKVKVLELMVATTIGQITDAEGDLPTANEAIIAIQDGLTDEQTDKLQEIVNEIQEIAGKAISDAFAKNKKQ